MIHQARRSSSTTTARISRRSLVLFAAGLALLPACSPGAAPVSHSAKDASSPTAPEGVSARTDVTETAPATSASTRPGDGQDGGRADDHNHDHHDHTHGHDGAPAASAGPQRATPGNQSRQPVAKPATYVCPMHPEVTSSAPGACPKCNMALVPKT